MRLALPIQALGSVFILASVSCTTVGGGETVSYDGTMDSMESLPDCGPDSQGSMFWVKEKNKAYECGKSNQWAERKNAKKPDDADEKSGDSEDAVTPRIMK